MQKPMESFRHRIERLQELFEKENKLRHIRRSEF